MESRPLRRLTLAIVAMATLAAAPAAQQPGTFALFNGTQASTSVYWPTNQNGLNETLNVKMFDRSGKISFTDYRIDMGATMHFFLIRDDFATFHHYSADYSAMQASFKHHFLKEQNHRYYLYTDSEPHGLKRQVFRFNIESAGAAQPAQPSLAASSENSTAGPYTVIFSKTHLPANQPYLMLVTIDRNGRGAEDLAPYLGFAAHMTIVNVSTLQYVFVHPTLRGQKLNKATSYTIEQEVARLQENSQVGPNQQVEIPGLPAGTYKAWYEFTGGVSHNKYTAPFTFVVQ